MVSRDSRIQEQRPGTAPEPAADPVTFGDVGVALVREVCTPELVRRQLSIALDALRRGDVLAEYGTEIVSARIGEPSIIADDGHELGFAVTIRAELESRFGPGLLALGFDSTVEIDLTLWLRTFSPAVVQLDVDPVKSDHLRVRAQARTDWLPVPLFGAGGVAARAERTLSLLSSACNHAIERSVRLRRVAVLEHLRRDLLDAEDAQEQAVLLPVTEHIPAEPTKPPDVAEPGPRTSFAQFGEELIRRGLDGRTVSAVLNSFLAQGTCFELGTPFPMWVGVDARIESVRPIPVEESELRFRLSLDVQVELRHRQDTDGGVFRAAMKAELTVRVAPSVNPSALRVSFERVPRRDVRFVRARWLFRGRSVPVPVFTLSGPLRRRLVGELNERLAEAARPLVLTELRAGLGTSVWTTR